MERRHGAASFLAPSYDFRLTSSHSKKTGWPHRLSPPVFVLTPQREIERRDRLPFEEKNRDVQPPSFEYT